MKRTLDDAECHASKELFLQTQNCSDGPSAILRVFGLRDLVVNVLAPQLDLQSLFNLSLVNWRLRELLSQTDTLQKAKHYKGTYDDFPETLLAYPDLRITRHMTHGEQRSVWTRSICHSLNKGVIQAEYYAEHLILPFLECQTLSDEQVTDHLTIVFFSVLGMERSMQMFEQSQVTRNTFQLMYKMMTRAHARVKDARIPFWLFESYANATDMTFPYRVAMAHRCILIAQSAANPKARDALERKYKPGLENADRTMLFVAAMSTPSFLASERVRLKQCVAPQNLLAIACVFGVEPVINYLLETDGTPRVMQLTLDCLSGDDQNMIDLYLLIDRFNQMEGAPIRDVIAASVRERIVHARERLQLMLDTFEK